MSKIQSSIRIAVLACCLVGLEPGGARAADDRALGVYFDAAATQCHGTIVPGTPGTVYVVAKVDANAPGVAGAEFRFRGVPDSWQTYPVANPSIIAIGDPFGQGVTTAFGSCEGEGGGIVVLYTVLVLASSQVSDVRFGLANREPPTNPDFRCPLILNCDFNFSKLCVSPVPCMVNPSRPGPCADMAVSPESWSVVKSFYR